MVDATGTGRRLRALQAIGWSWPLLAAELRVRSPRWPSKLASGRTPTVSRATAAQIAALYDRLSFTPGPSDVTRTWAAKRGWPPPLAWDDDQIDNPQAQAWADQTEDAAPVVDEVAIQRALTGERIKLTRLEKHHAVHAGIDRLGLNVVAERLHLSGTAAKDLHRRPLPAQPALAA
jgi:hypothetical protein